jgi:hypothetical protein
MPLRFKYPSKDQVPAEHAAFYVERDGAVVLDVEGAVEKSRLDEFRNNNVALQKQLTDLGQRFEGLIRSARGHYCRCSRNWMTRI